MHIRRLTLTLPARMRGTAERDARLIAQGIAERLGPDAAPNLTLTLQGSGAPGHAVAQQVATRIGSKTGGQS